MIMDHIARVYAILIIDGDKKFKDIPDQMKESVKKILIEKNVDSSLYE